MRTIEFFITSTIIASAACAGSSAFDIATTRLVVAVMLDASDSFGERAAPNHCPEFTSILGREVTPHSGAVRVMSLATGSGAAPNQIFDATYAPAQSGFARRGAVATTTRAFVARGTAACEARWKQEKSSPIRATLQALFDNVAAAEGEAARRGEKVETHVHIVSDLQEEVDAAWKRARQKPTSETIAAIRPLVVPASVVGVEVCGIAESRARNVRPDESETAKLVLKQLLGTTPFTVAATCPKAVAEVQP